MPTWHVTEGFFASLFWQAIYRKDSVYSQKMWYALNSAWIFQKPNFPHSPQAEKVHAEMVLIKTE